MKISMLKMKSSFTILKVKVILSLSMQIPGLEDRVLEELDGEHNQDIIGMNIDQKIRKKWRNSKSSKKGIVDKEKVPLE